MSDDKISLLKETHIFSDLDSEELSFVAERVALRECKRGQVILFEEDTNQYMYAVLKGEVKVFNTTEDGKESVVAFHGAGESFGEVSLIDQETTPATVEAVEPSLIMIIGRDDFFEIIFSQQKVMNQLLLLLAGRLRQSWSQVRMLHFKDASVRIASAIKSMSEERGEPCDDGVLINLRLTHQNIADITGLTRETVTRVIDKWKKKGLLSVDDSRHMRLSHDFLNNNFIL